MKNKKFDNIIRKYKNLKYNDNVFFVGGGLTSDKFASNRHENALSDKGKLTIGKAAQLFKNASGQELNFVKSLILFVVPLPEWHHSGKLPKSYGGGMKKTYFLNAEQITDIAENWDDYVFKLKKEKDNLKAEAEEEEKKNILKRKFLNIYAEKVSRQISKPNIFYPEREEMNGKYGWFDADYKYSLPVYYSGWSFFRNEDLQRFYNEDFLIKKDDIKTIYVKENKNVYYETMFFKWNKKGRLITRSTFLKNIKRINQEREEKEKFLIIRKSAEIKAADFLNKFYKEKEREEKLKKLQSLNESNNEVSLLINFFNNEFHPAPAEIVQIKKSYGLSWNELRKKFAL